MQTFLLFLTLVIPCVAFRVSRPWMRSYFPSAVSRRAVVDDATMNLLLTIDLNSAGEKKMVTLESAEPSSPNERPPPSPPTPPATTVTAVPTSTKTFVPKNSLLIDMAKGIQTEKTPVWLFRQAGRHLPEYKALKKENGKNFLEILEDPELVAECTMQPVRRYDLDAAILFSDILVLLQALGIDVTMPGGVGIQVPEPIRTVEEGERLVAEYGELVGSESFVVQKLGHVFDAISLILEKLQSESISIPLIGFSAAPYTLMYYMLGGSSKKNKSVGMDWLRENTEVAQKFMDILSDLVVEYCSMQVKTGVHAIQLFEAMGMMIDDELFNQFALPSLVNIKNKLKERHPDVPLMVFARGASFANAALSQHYDVVTIDGTVDRAKVRGEYRDGVVLQGNYDPDELVLKNGKTKSTVEETTRAYLDEIGCERLIANLAGGLGGKESVQLVKHFVDVVHRESKKKSK